MNELEAKVTAHQGVSKRLVSLVQETASTHTHPPEDEGVTRSVAEDRRRYAGAVHHSG